VNWAEERFEALLVDRRELGAFRPAHGSGHGFVDEITPEIRLWVRHDWRGRGVSTMRTTGASHNGASLSKLANAPARLYASEGFT
jgi:hypothetical protein